MDEKEMFASDAPRRIWSNTLSVRLMGVPNSIAERKNTTKQKRLQLLGAFSLNLILAVTYVPASLPAQYHRPCKA